MSVGLKKTRIKTPGDLNSNYIKMVKIEKIPVYSEGHKSSNYSSHDEFAHFLLRTRTK